MATRRNKDLSINDLQASTRAAIFKKFNIEMSIGGDYRTFAALLQMPNDDITTISQSHRNHTEEIFKWWEPKDDATVKNLRKILEEMERHDLIRILDQDLNVQGRKPNAIGVASTEAGTGRDDVDSTREPIVHDRRPDPPAIVVTELDDMQPKEIEWDKAISDPVDVLLMVVNDNELRAVYNILPDPEVADNGKDLTDVYFATIGKNRVALVRSGMGAGGRRGIQAMVMDAINQLDPKAIISVGVCFGMKDDQKLADVLVSEKLGTYGPAKVNAYGRELSRGVVHECNARLSGLFSNKMGWKGVSQLEGSQKPKVHSGLIISGPQLINNKKRKEQLQDIYSTALGGEMEGEGLYNICEKFGVPWIVCKAICDWADGTKDDKWQLYAAAVAASFVEHVLKKKYVPESKRRKSGDHVDEATAKRIKKMV